MFFEIPSIEHVKSTYQPFRIVWKFKNKSYRHVPRSAFKRVMSASDRDKRNSNKDVKRNKIYTFFCFTERYISRNDQYSIEWQLPFIDCSLENVFKEVNAVTKPLCFKTIFEKNNR